MSFASVGGYRLVRKLGSGRRAEVFLGHAETKGTAAATVAVKVFRPAVSRESIGREIEALERANHDHCVRLLDIATDPGGLPAILMERLPRGSLSRLFQDRVGFEPGECVTIIAPIAHALDRLHTAGVAHGGLSMDAVLFRESGAPVLIGFGSAQLLDPNPTLAMIAADSRVADDLLSLSALARAVLAHAGNAGGAAEAAEWFGTWRAGAIGDNPAAEAAERMFRVATAVPVRFADDEVRVEAAEPVIRPTLVRQAVPERIDPRSLTALSSRVLGSVRAVRRPVWLLAGVAGLGLVAALALMPQGEASTQRADLPPAGPAAGHAGPVLGDDPVAALPGLLAARDRCIADLSMLCLDDVDAPGSMASASDQALIRAIQLGAEPAVQAVSTANPALVERLGDAALVSLGNGPDSRPASVLLMKGEAGWRIREFLD